MLSWIMTLWLNKHEKSEWPVLPVSQPDDAIHVTNSEEHPSREDIEKMCSQGFFTRHKYLYVDSVRQNETDTAEVYEYDYTNSQLPPPPSSPAFRQSTSSNHCDGVSNDADEHETNQVNSATEMVFEEATYRIIRNEEHTAGSVSSTDSISSGPAEASKVSNVDRRPQNHIDGVACANSSDGDFYDEINVDEPSSDEATGRAKGHATGAKSAKDDSEGGHVMYENAGYKDLVSNKEHYMSLGNNQEEPKMPGYINVLAEETGVPSSHSESGNKGTPVDPYVCVDLIYQAPRQGTKDIATTESLSCNEHDPNTEHQRSFEVYEDMTIQLLLNDAESLYHREVQRRKYEEKLQGSWYENQSSPLEQVLFQEHLNVYANVLTNLDVGFGSSLHLAMKSIGSRLVECDKETSL